MKKLIMKAFVMSFILMFLSANSNADDVVIIVNEQNPLTELTESQLINFYLKKVRQWPSGDSVRFFDQQNDKEERRNFLANYIKKSTREVELYWIGQKLYTGNSAPLQISSDSMMANVVARFPGAIGYVSSTFQGGRGVKKIIISRE